MYRRIPRPAQAAGSASLALLSALQHRLSEFLRLELFHSLGAYRRAADELREVEKRLEEDQQLADTADAVFPLADLVRIMREYNHTLDLGREPSDRDCRHPSPARMPLSHPTTFVPGRDAADVTAKQSLQWVCAFYDAALHAIGHDPAKAPPREWTVPALQRAVLARRADLHRPSGEEPRAVDAAHAARRRARFQRRRSEAIAAGIPGGAFAAESEETATPAATAATIATSDLTVRHQLPLAVFVLRALVDAHLLMHEVEAHLSAPLGERLQRAVEHEEALRQALRRSIALNTFVWAAARIAPWMFAEDENERRYIVRYYTRAWGNTMPMRAMWIGAQVSLLALHRRAYARSLGGDVTGAYKDFHKLQRHVRETGRRVRGASLHVEGAMEFLDSLDALADHHIGELYRRDRDHTNALIHYRRAFHRLERLRDERGQLVLVNSRWFVDLQLSLGKACYEMGQHKACLAWYLRTWRSLLNLIAADTAGNVSPGAIDTALRWLDRVVDEPEIHKRDVVSHLAPVIRQIEAFRVDPRFTALASDILVRLGHLLFVLNLGEQRSGDVSREPPAPEARLQPDTGSLALRCVRRAWQLDKRSTIALSDLLKLHFRASRGRGRPSPALETAIEAAGPVEEQWPGGATSLERMSRAIEYVLLQQLRVAPRPRDPRRAAARELLHSFLMHTDSIDARKSQVHEYLTRASTPSEMPGDNGEPALEFVCLRRYSSAYPILPRPQAFRAHGGGYFVRAHPAGGDGRGLGIAIDPGNSYVECLYRTGFTLSDIDVIVATHDHVDHASSLEPLLALRHEMRGFGRTRKPLIVVGNKSIVERLEDLEIYSGDASLTFARLDGEAAEIDALNETIVDRMRALPESDRADSTEFRLTPLPSTIGDDGKGHNDLAGNPSFGVILTIRDREGGHTRSLAISSDLPRLGKGVPWPRAWDDALAADMLVCHLSTVPLAELRQMAGLTVPREGVIRRDIGWINEHWLSDDIRGRLAYAYWLGDADAPHLHPVGDDRRLRQWEVPPHHPYLGGLMQLAEAFEAGARDDPGAARRRLFVVGELSEELGSFRGKVAVELNRRIFGAGGCQAVTGDIGLRVVLTAAAPAAGGASAVRVMCSTCDLDNDLAPMERYHDVGRIHELCVKGENEGVFYNCAEHDPSGDTDDPTFIERLERYDVFGR